MRRSTEVAEETDSHRETEKRRAAENRARQRADVVGRARSDKTAGNANHHPFRRLRFLQSCRFVTRYAGLSRATADKLRSSSVAPFLCGIPFPPSISLPSNN